MAQKSSIEWTEQTWNPVSGCTKISPGCRECYASVIANRFWKDRKFTDVQTHPHKLQEPLKRKKPTTYFVNSMSDMFHEAVPFEFLDQMFTVMATTPQHTYQVLTKRPERAAEYFRYVKEFDNLEEEISRLKEWNKVHSIDDSNWPLPNVWLGVSVENQEQADKRIPELLQIPAAVRFLSCEPLLEAVDLESFFWGVVGDTAGYFVDGKPRRHPGLAGQAMCRRKLNALHWVIVGGESGHNARPCDVAWIRSIVQQCNDANVACFVKQLGSVPHIRESTKEEYIERTAVEFEWPEGTSFQRTRVCLNDKKGDDPLEWPEDLRVREFPIIGASS